LQAPRRPDSTLQVQRIREDAEMKKAEFALLMLMGIGMSANALAQDTRPDQSQEIRKVAGADGIQAKEPARNLTYRIGSLAKKKKLDQPTNRVCACGCCDGLPVNGFCQVHVSFLGYIMEDSAQCIPDDPNDHFCDEKCQIFFPGKCPPVEMANNCYEIRDNRGRPKALPHAVGK
jgi:hypothetical protein